MIPFDTESLQLKIQQFTVSAKGEALPNFYGKIATTIAADRTGSITMLDSVNANSVGESLFLVLMLTVFVYCIHTTPGHVTVAIHGYNY